MQEEVGVRPVVQHEKSPAGFAGRDGTLHLHPLDFEEVGDSV
jgi:hypothetical protein